MRAIPGVVQDSAGGIHLNGGAEEQVLYTLDGFELNDPLSGRFESRLSVEAVRTMEVSEPKPGGVRQGGGGHAGNQDRDRRRPFRYTGTNFIPGLENRKGFGYRRMDAEIRILGAAAARPRVVLRQRGGAVRPARGPGTPQRPGPEHELAGEQPASEPVQSHAVEHLYTGFLTNFWIAPRKWVGGARSDRNHHRPQDAPVVPSTSRTKSTSTAGRYSRSATRPPHVRARDPAGALPAGRYRPMAEPETPSSTPRAKPAATSSWRICSRLPFSALGAATK